MVNTSLQNWYQNTTFRKVIDHRLVSHIPGGALTWRMPLTSDQIPWITFPPSPFTEPITSGRREPAMPR